MLKIIRCQTTVGLTPTAGLNFKGMIVPTFFDTGSPGTIVSAKFC